ncbi:MAG: hypothetical protein RBT69_03305 [Spirochaetia bacterium]|jgi:ATP phosphoribosyltransferase|nr:hypothetical protein [Spirochaetia bacterium]
MENNQLVIGMPAGSLANSKRGGNLIELLEHSGFPTKGYDSGGPTSFTSVNFLFGWDGRPQEFGTQLALNELDVAIAGNDWIEERRLELKIEYGVDIKLEKILSLNRGNVKLVGIVDEEVKETSTVEYLKNFFKNGKKRITVVSELPYMSLFWIQEKMKKAGLDNLAKSWSVQKYKTPPKVEEGILIYETWGKTEAKIKNLGADIGLEITQSGSALKNYGLKVIDDVFSSETSIWVSPEVLKNSEKKELLKMLALNLYGSINAESKVLLIFNVPEEKKGEIEDYLTKYNLYADEPTRIPGSKYSQYSIQLAVDRKDTPIAKVRYELIKIGARSVETMPILSSIPDLSSVLVF